ncbi:PREDICTED: homeobox protein GBX-2 [Bison bison bison]|uniref:Homeobox protein GBX-2 n=1 Tax=Bison bison bison TaxID=43346 RepID=A0A6P3J1B6_BISBB|nr:PREDICTED: homeobox protein GBX-2 [Bison bison bison]
MSAAFPPSLMMMQRPLGSSTAFSIDSLIGSPPQPSPGHFVYTGYPMFMPYRPVNRRAKWKRVKAGNANSKTGEPSRNPKIVVPIPVHRPVASFCAEPQISPPASLVESCTPPSPRRCDLGSRVGFSLEGKRAGLRISAGNGVSVLGCLVGTSPEATKLLFDPKPDTVWGLHLPAPPGSGPLPGDKEDALSGLTPSANFCIKLQETGRVRRRPGGPLSDGSGQRAVAFGAVRGQGKDESKVEDDPKGKEESFSLESDLDYSSDDNLTGQAAHKEEDPGHALEETPPSGGAAGSTTSTGALGTPVSARSSGAGRGAGRDPDSLRVPKISGTEIGPGMVSDRGDVEWPFSEGLSPLFGARRAVGEPGCP